MELLLTQFLTRTRRLRGQAFGVAAITVPGGMVIAGTVAWHREVWNKGGRLVEVEIVEALPGQEKITVWPVCGGYTHEVFAHQVVFEVA